MIQAQTKNKTQKLLLTQSENALSILFVTDIHLSFEYAQRLVKWHHNHKIHFDVILIGGDTANCDQNGKTHNQAQQLADANKILIHIQKLFGCKMYYIPGNHDPLQHYQKCHLINNQIQSINERTIQLVQGLQITGFGGSVPGYLDTEETKQIWKGFPFQSNQALTTYCEQKKIFTSQNLTGNQRIYLTHCGPFDYETSIDRRQPHSVIYGGAKYYNTLIEHKNLLLYLHGHVHAGSRYAKGNQIPIVNAGNLSGGEFGYFLLQRNQQDQKWKISQSHFVQL